MPADGRGRARDLRADGAPPAGGLHAADRAAHAARGRALLRPLPGPHAGRRPDALRRARSRSGRRRSRATSCRSRPSRTCTTRSRAHAPPLLAALRVDGRAGRAARGRRADGRGGPAATTRSTRRSSRTRCRSRRRPSTPRSRRCRACAAPAREFRRGVRRGARRPRLAAGRLEGEQRGDPRRRPCARSSGVPRAALSDDDAIRMVLDPAQNRILGETLTLTTHGKLSRALFHPSLHVPQEALAHRRQPGPAPPHDAGLAAGAAGVPLGRAGLHRPDARRATCPRRDALYRETMEETWEAIGELRARGVADEFAAYLLPNAVAIRFTESADLLNLHHKFAMRLCYNAQEEIWRASLDEALQIREVNPRIGPWLLPPCTLRHHRRACAPSAPRASASAASSSGNRTRASTRGRYSQDGLTMLVPTPPRQKPGSPEESGAPGLAFPVVRSGSSGSSWSPRCGGASRCRPTSRCAACTSCSSTSWAGRNRPSTSSASDRAFSEWRPRTAGR